MLAGSLLAYEAVMEIEGAIVALADGMPIKVTCSRAHCTARAALPGQLTQSLWLMEEKGVVLIDGASIHD